MRVQAYTRETSKFSINVCVYVESIGEIWFHSVMRQSLKIK